MPIQRIPAGRYDPLADWIEDYILDEVLDKNPGTIFEVAVERRSDYYAAKVFTTDATLIDPLTSLASEIEDELEKQGAKVVIYPELEQSSAIP